MCIRDRARIHRRNKHHVTRIRQRRTYPRNRHAPVLERLAQHLKYIFIKLRQLVQKQHAIVRQADLTRLWRPPAAGQPVSRNRVVRVSEPVSYTHLPCSR